MIHQREINFHFRKSVLFLFENLSKSLIKRKASNVYFRIKKFE